MSAENPFDTQEIRQPPPRVSAEENQRTIVLKYADADGKEMTAKVCLTCSPLVVFLLFAPFLY